jgi:hypothetical protein
MGGAQVITIDLLYIMRDITILRARVMLIIEFTEVLWYCHVPNPLCEQ